MISVWRQLSQPQRWGLLAGLLLFLVYVGNAWTPSHWGVAADRMGIEHAGPAFGEPRFERSDEWAVLTPYFRIAVANDFGSVDLHSPYRESLVSFFALPSRDWSMAFKPDLWGFLVIDPAHAYSLHYAILASAMLVGFALVLRQLGCRPAYAIFGSAILFLSQFVQVWWTSNAPVFAWAPWPLVIFLWRGPWFIRAPAMAYAVATWLIGFLYPPFILAAGIAFLTLTLMFRPDAWRPRLLIPAAIGAVIGAAVAWAHFSELIPAMAQTVYPGRRVSNGGGVSVLQLAAHLLPNVATWGFDPLPGLDSNVCEIGVVGSILPLAAICFSSPLELRAWMRRHRPAMLLWLLVLTAMIAWMAAPIPGRFAPGLNLIPGQRMLWGFGLLLSVGVIRLLSETPLIFTRIRIEIFCSVIIIAWALSKHVFATEQGFGLWFDLLPVLVLGAFLLVGRLRPPATRPEITVLATALLSSALTFGLFNPIQPARPIFAPADSAFLREVRAYVAANPKHVAVVSRWYGAALNAVGIPSINHALLRPELGFFRSVYPNMSAEAFDQTFNRYGHFTPVAGDLSPTVGMADAIHLTPDPFALPVPVQLGPGPVTQPTEIEDIRTSRIDDRHWEIAVVGWAPWSGVTPDQRVKVDVSPAFGAIVKASAYRMPRPGLVDILEDESKFAPGFTVRIILETKSPVDTLAPAALKVGATDGTADHPIGEAGQAHLTEPR